MRFVVVGSKTSIIPGWYTGRLRRKVEKKGERKGKKYGEKDYGEEGVRKKKRFSSK